LGRVQRRPTAGEARGGQWRWRSCPTAPWNQGGGERRPKMEGRRVVVALTGEKEDNDAWVKNWLRDGEIDALGIQVEAVGSKGYHRSASE
jgi:hypothetical protein